MTWHYMDGDEEVGPIEKEELQQLVKQKKVVATTLVRGPGMSEYKALGTIVRRPPPPRAAPPPPAEPPPPSEPPPLKTAPPELSVAPSTPMPTLECSECGRTFPEDEIVRFDNANICAACKPAFVQKIKEGMPVSGRYEYGGFWIRFGAKLIDNVILTVLNILIMGIAGAIAPAGESKTAMAINTVIGVGSMIFPFVYSVWFIGKYAATPGKMVCGLKIIRSDGEKVGYARALGRQFAEVLSALILSAGYIMAAFNDEKKTLHDIICDTRVVKK